MDVDAYRERHRRHRAPSEARLRQIHLEPESGCNLKCVTCSNASASNPRGRMPLETAKRVMDEAFAEIGPEGILGLYIRGESVMHPELPAMVRYAAGLGFRRIRVSTNVMLLDERRARALLEAGLSELRLSIDAVDASIFEALRCGSRYAVIERNMETLAAVRSELGSTCHFRLHAALHRRGFAHVPRFVRRWDAMIQCFKFTVAVNQGGLFAPDRAASFSGMPFATSTDYKIPCRILYDYIGVTHDGKMTSCCVDYREAFVVGHLEDGLAKGFDNDASRALRHRHERGDFGPLCGACGFNNVLVDWFEDEINAWVEEHREGLVSGSADLAYKRLLDETVEKFNRVALAAP